MASVSKSLRKHRHAMKVAQDGIARCKSQLKALPPSDPAVPRIKREKLHHKDTVTRLEQAGA